MKRASKPNKKITTVSQLLPVHGLLSNVFDFWQDSPLDPQTSRFSTTLYVNLIANPVHVKCWFILGYASIKFYNNILRTEQFNLMLLQRACHSAKNNLNNSFHIKLFPFTYLRYLIKLYGIMFLFLIIDLSLRTVSLECNCSISTSHVPFLKCSREVAWH